MFNNVAIFTRHSFLLPYSPGARACRRYLSRCCNNFSHEWHVCCYSFWLRFVENARINGTSRLLNITLKTPKVQWSLLPGTGDPLCSEPLYTSPNSNTMLVSIPSVLLILVEFTRSGQLELRS